MTKNFDHKNEFRGGWIGVDFDGTLATYTGWKGSAVLGEPLMPMVNRVRQWLAQGIEVRIVTARACPVKPKGYENDIPTGVAAIHEWCIEHIGQPLVVTYQKDYNMIELWDDRAVQVIPNDGRRVTSLLECCGNCRFASRRLPGLICCNHDKSEWCGEIVYGDNWCDVWKMKRRKSL
jgi:hypothetical protein